MHSPPNMPYHVVHISPDQRALSTQDLKFTVWRPPPPPRDVCLCYAVNLDTLYTTDEERVKNQVFFERIYLGRRIYTIGKGNTTANKDGDFDTWHLVRQKRPKKPHSKGYQGKLKMCQRTH